MAQTYNLSDGIEESFEFNIKGHNYLLKYLTTEEFDEMNKIIGENDSEKLNVFLEQFITKKDPASPSFTEVQRKMIAPEWKNFRKMIAEEFGS